MKCVIKDKQRERVLCDSLEVADSFMSRFLGLMGRAALDASQGLWIPRCNSIHTFFMRFPIDVVFLDQNKKIIDTKMAVPSYRILKPCWKAKSVLELPQGKVASEELAIGMELEFI